MTIPIEHNAIPTISIEIIIISTIIPPTICEDNIKTKNAPINM